MADRSTLIRSCLRERAVRLVAESWPDHATEWKAMRWSRRSSAPVATEPVTNRCAARPCSGHDDPSLAAVEAHSSQVIDEVAGTHERVTVTKNGSPVAVILAVEDYESLMETLEILSDPKAVAEIRQAEAQMRDGTAYDEAAVRAALAARRA